MSAPRDLLVAALAGALGLSALVGAATPAPQPPPPRVPDLVAPPTAAPAKGSVVTFTERQAYAGRLLYYEHCAVCHGGDLSGHIGPALAGPDGNTQYETGRYVFSYMSSHMPVGDSGGLPQGDYVAIMAFLYASHQRRPGTKPLTAAMASADVAKLGGAASPAPKYSSPPVP